MDTWPSSLNLARTARWLALLAAVALPCAAQNAAQGAAQKKNTCLECHATLFDRLLVTAQQHAQDIHTQKGLTCVSCHGGDETSDDAERAMSWSAGFRGPTERAKVPALCAGCHADAAYMRGFNPSLRTDQRSQYRTSIHGKRLAGGDTRVAVCSDCHGVHGMRPAGDSRSRVHPLNVANTCATCHANAEHMKGYKIPVDQFAGYTASVHHQAMAVRSDLSAPTCTTCHGNHGAAPPGVAAVEFVCSTCHVFQAQLFDTSPHKPAFAIMGLATCITCHSNHRIAKPSDAMIGTGKDAVCLNCHSEGDAGYAGSQKMRAALDQLSAAIARADRALEVAENSGMEVSQAKLEHIQARDALTKARVTIHSFQPAKVDEDIKPGLEVAAKSLKAGTDALAERDFRRMGLGISLLTIVAVVAGLGLYIRKLEAAPNDG